MSGRWGSHRSVLPHWDTSPLQRASCTIWENNSFSVFDCKNSHESCLFVMWLCRPCYLDLVSISSNGLIWHVKCGKSAKVAILILGTCTFYSLPELCQPTTRAHQTCLWEDEGPGEPDHVRSSMPAATSDMRGQPWSAERHTHPTVNCRCQRNPAEPEKWSSQALSQTVNPYRSDWNKQLF